MKRYIRRRIVAVGLTAALLVLPVAPVSAQESSAVRGSALEEAGTYEMDYTGVAKGLDGRKWYYVHGVPAVWMNGVVQDPDGDRWYVQLGKVQTSYTGLAEDSDGNTWYVKKGKVPDKTGVVQVTDGDYRLLEHGKVRTSFTGIYKDSDGIRWYVKKGKVQTDKSGLQEVDGQMVLLKNGRVRDYTGKYSANGGTYKLSNGVVTGVRFSVPAVSQTPTYPTGCEGASACSLLRFTGYNVTLKEMMGDIPCGAIYYQNGRRYGPSIYEKFVGNPKGTYTSANPGYGAFAPVVTKAMNTAIQDHNGKKTAKNITGADVSALYKHLRKGRPLVVWATYNMMNPTSKNSWYIKTSSGDQYFSYPRGTHVMVLTGYDANYIYVMDPYGGNSKTFSRSTFNTRYKLLGQQAIVVQ